MFVCSGDAVICALYIPLPDNCGYFEKRTGHGYFAPILPRAESAPADSKCRASNPVGAGLMV